MTAEQIAALRERVSVAVRLAGPAADRARFTALHAVSIEDLQRLLDEREALLDAAMEACNAALDDCPCTTILEAALAKAEAP